MGVTWVQPDKYDLTLHVQWRCSLMSNHFNHLLLLLQNVILLLPKHCRVIMVTLWNRAGHYIFVLWFLLSSSFFLFSSPILSCCILDVYHTSTPHTYTLLLISKIAKNSLSGHHRTTLSGCIFTTKACIHKRKKT